MNKSVHHRLRVGGKAGETVNLTKLAEVFGVGRDTIMEWIAKGMPEFPQPRGSVKRQFDTAMCIKWKAQYELDSISAKYEEKLAEQVETNPDKMTKGEADTRKAVAGALMAELELAKSRGQVANIEDLMENFTTALVNVRAKLVGLPTRMAGDLAHQDAAAVTKLLDKEITEMLTALSDYDHQYEGDIA